MIATAVSGRGYGRTEVSCNPCQGFLFAVGGVGETGKDIVVGEVGEVYKDFFGSHAGGKVGEDIIDGDTHTSDAGFAATLARFEGDDVLVVHSGCCDRDCP